MHELRNINENIIIEWLLIIIIINKLQAVLYSKREVGMKKKEARESKMSHLVINNTIK